MKRVIAPPPLIYAAAFIPGWLIDRAVALPEMPGIVRGIVGVIFIVPGLFIAINAMLAFRRARTTVSPYGHSTAVITDGVFRYSRNPLYLTLALFYVGAALALDAPLTLILLPMALWVMHWGVITREERYLEEKFGDQYLHYKARVRRWI